MGTQESKAQRAANTIFDEYELPEQRRNDFKLETKSRGDGCLFFLCTQGGKIRDGNHITTHSGGADHWHHGTDLSLTLGKDPNFCVNVRGGTTQLKDYDYAVLGNRHHGHDEWLFDDVVGGFHLKDKPDFYLSVWNGRPCNDAWVVVRNKRLQAPTVWTRKMLSIRETTRKVKRIFLSHTAAMTATALLIKESIQSQLPENSECVVEFWSMEDIPFGAGSKDDPTFNEIITSKMEWCSTVLGIADESCEHSHPKWGSPAEWKMGMDRNKKVLVCYPIGKFEVVKKNPTVKEVADKCQFHAIPAIPDINDSESIKIIRALVKGLIIPSLR